MGALWWLRRRNSNNRWMMMAVGMWIMCCSGGSYLYSEYSESIKDALHYDQETLDTVGFFKELGESVGIVSGLLYDVWPAWAVFLLGAAQVSGGYLLAFLSVSPGGLPRPPTAPAAMALYLCVGANGQSFFITATLVSLVKRFPASRGMVIGVMKGLVGLSAAVLTQAQRALYPPAAGTSSRVLLFLSWFPTTAVLASYLLFHSGDDASPEFDQHEGLYLGLFAGVALALAAFLMAVIAAQNTAAAFPAAVNRGVCLVILVILLLPLGIAAAAVLRRRRGDPLAGSVTEPLLLPPPAGQGNSEAGSGSGDGGGGSSSAGHDGSNLARVDSFQQEFPARGEDHTLRQAAGNVDFWLLVVIAGIAMGSGLTAMDNVAQVGASLGYADASIISFVSMVSIFNFLGRLGAGLLSEFCLHEWGVPRPAFIVSALLALALGHAIMAIALSGALYVGSVMIGLSFGAHWSLVPAATSELFGLKHFGTLLNAVTMASPIGSYVLSVRLAGYLYDAEAQKQNSHKTLLPGLVRRGARWAMGGGDYVVLPNYSATSESKGLISCKGAVCFRLTFFIMAGLCVVGSLLGALLLARTRKFYTELAYERCRSNHDGDVRRLEDSERPAESPTSVATKF